MKTIFVAGLGRCGSSLTMQMLHKAGVDCYGTYPSFEDENMEEINFEKHKGKAIKLLFSEDYFKLPDMDCDVILLHRNTREQAKSQAKLIELFAGIPIDRKGRRDIERGLKRDYVILKRWALKNRCLQLSFEQIINTPFYAAKQIIDFLKLDADPLRVSDVVISRSTDCYDGMLESTLID